MIEILRSMDNSGKVQEPDRAGGIICFCEGSKNINHVGMQGGTKTVARAVRKTHNLMSKELVAMCGAYNIKS